MTGVAAGRAAAGRPALLPPRGVKPVVFGMSLLPVAAWLARGLADFDGGFGANPVEFLTRSSGFWTLTFLCLALTVAPLRRLTGRVWLMRLRRMLGLFTFFYACLHFTTYLWFDQWFDIASIVRDIAKRPFITVGFAAFLLLIPLAATSTQAAIRRLGRRWQLLHRLVYVVAILALLHFWWHKAGKNDFAVPTVFAVIVALLLGERLVRRLRQA
jgi:sulfoxide reductase heme-binding subunit YedZ